MAGIGADNGRSAREADQADGAKLTNDGLKQWHLDDLTLRNLRPASIRQRGYVLGRLERHLEGRPFLDAEPYDLTAFLARDLQPESRAVETTHLRQFYAWAVDVELLDLSPARRLRRPRVPRRIPQPMSEGDLAMAVELAPARIRPWLILGAFAGLRASEMAQLHTDDLWWHHDPPLLIVNDGKGGHGSAVPMSTELIRLLGTCDLPPAGWLFPRRDSRPGHTPGHLVSQLTNRYLHSVGIDRTLHKTRHRFGTELLKASGGNLRVTQEGMRHASIKSTELYTYVNPTEVAQAVEGLPPLGGHTSGVAA
jgi:site-specific recombinase XerD